MKQRTNSFTIHSFHLNFPNFIPEIIRPLYISTSILSTFFPWNREYVKINSLLIPYFSEFSFFFKSKTRKKKRTNLLLFKFTKFHSLLNRLYLFQQSSSHRETKNGQSRFSSISYLSANFFSQLSSPRFLTNIYTMKHTEGGGEAKSIPFDFMSQFPFVALPSPPSFENLEDRRNYYRQWSAAKCRHAPLVRTPGRGIQSGALRSRIRYRAKRLIDSVACYISIDILNGRPGQIHFLAHFLAPFGSNTPGDGPRVMNKNSLQAEPPFKHTRIVYRPFDISWYQTPDIWHFLLSFLSLSLVRIIHTRPR